MIRSRLTDWTNENETGQYGTKDDKKRQSFIFNYLVKQALSQTKVTNSYQTAETIIMAERFFEKVAENVLQASEQIVNRMEEGFSVLTTGDLPKGSQQEDTMDSSNEQEFDLDDIDIDNLSEEEIQRIMAEEMMQNSPLDGIADSVIGDIVAGQVRQFPPWM